MLAAAAIITELITLAWLGGALALAAVGAMSIAFIARKAAQLF